MLIIYEKKRNTFTFFLHVSGDAAALLWMPGCCPAAQLCVVTARTQVQPTATDL